MDHRQLTSPGMILQVITSCVRKHLEVSYVSTTPHLEHHAGDGIGGEWPPADQETEIRQEKSQVSNEKNPGWLVYGI